MNTIVISIFISIITIYLMTISYNAYYFTQTVSTYKEKKIIFYKLEALLNYGEKFYKKNHEQITLPYLLKVELPLIGSGIIYIANDKNSIIIKAEIFQNNKSCGYHECSFEKISDESDNFKVLNWTAE